MYIIIETAHHMQVYECTNFFFCFSIKRKFIIVSSAEMKLMSHRYARYHPIRITAHYGRLDRALQRGAAISNFFST